MTYEFIQGNPAHTSGPNGPITRLVLHGTVSPCAAGGAEAVAHYFQRADSGGLAHYVVDPTKVVQCCHDDIACWHAPPNHGSIGIELCDPQSGLISRWTDGNHNAMLVLARQLVHELAKEHSVPLTYVDAAGLQTGHHGVTTHREVSLAFNQSTHTDPGSGFGPTMAYLLGYPPPILNSHVFPGILHRGMTEPAVADVRNRFRVGSGNYFGDDLNVVIRNFQHERKLTVDGVIGPVTWAQIWR